MLTVYIKVVIKQQVYHLGICKTVMDTDLKK